MRDSTRSTKASAAPMSTMKWASIIIAMSTDVSALNAVRHPSSSHHPNQAFRNSPGSSLSYADSVISSQRRFRTFSTRLDYTDDGNSNHDAADTRPSTSSTPTPMIPKFWNNLFPSPSPEVADDTESEQEMVDGYLEFLDRRYKRLHEPEEEEIKPFSAIDWLMQGSPKQAEETKETRQDDALYVLGVAGLASQKLLQRKQQSITGREQHEPATIDVVASPSTEEPSQAPTSKAVKAALPLIRALYVIQHRRMMFINFYSRQLESLRRATLKSIRAAILSAPTSLYKALNTIVEVGGGKKTIAMAITVVSALLLLLRPVFQAAVADGSVMS